MGIEWESDLSKNSIKRYTRQIIVPNVGIDGQKRIEKTRILIVGLGGLGSPVLAYIGMAGVNQIGVVDFDSVEIHNLQRQLAHTENRIGMSKVKSAIQFLNGLNSSVKIIGHDVLMDETNCLDIIHRYDIVIDCCDQIGLRYAIADACRDLGKSLVNGSVLRWGGQICVFPSGGRCFRCVFPEMKSQRESCDESGVIGSMCGVVGSMQTTEAIKLALGEVKRSKMIILNGYNNFLKSFELNCKPCKYCLEIQKIKNCTDNKVENGIYNNKINNCIAGSKQNNSISKNDIDCSKNKKVNKHNVITWRCILENPSQFKIYDIRNELHFQMFRVKNSVNVAYDVDKLVHNGPETVVISCYRGISSNKAVDLLRNKGIKAFSAEDGIEGFKREINF